MHPITRPELRHWASLQHPHSVTIYSPLRTTHPQKVEDAVLVGSLLDQAASQLEVRGAPQKEIRATLQAGRDLVADSSVWRSNASHGLCLFASPEASGCYSLPFSCATTIDAGPDFYVTPLAYALQLDVEYHLLALSPKAVRLLRCRRDGVRIVELPAGVPRRIEDTEGGREIERTLQMHSGPRFRGTASMAGIVHGHGDPKDDRKMLLIDFFHVLAKHLEPLLVRDGLPVVLACVDYYRPLVRDAFHAAKIADDAVLGSHDHLGDNELWKQSLPIADSLRMQETQEVIRHFREAAANRIGERLGSIVPAARQGRVHQLLAALDQRVFGSLDGDTIRLSPGNQRRPSDIDLVDECVKQTLRHDGDVLVLPIAQMPGERNTAAVFRW